MRNTLPLLSRPPVVATSPQLQAPNSQAIPSIRLISATPSATGMSSEGSSLSYQHSFATDSSWASVPGADAIPSPIAPKTDAAARKKLVPKKSKLSLLTGGRDKERGKDLSDVVRRVGGGSTAARGGFEIYVDPTEDPELGDIVMVKKKKSRVALDGMKWGALGEVTNIPSAPREEGEKPQQFLKVKADGEGKWWSIGRGRKDSKEKEKEKEKEKNKEKENKRTKSPEPFQEGIKSVRQPPPRSKTPEPLRLSDTQSRARFNSLDSGILLNTPINMGPPVPPKSSSPPEPVTYSRSATPTAGGLLAPPSSAGINSSANQGSIALRAMRSVRSLARMSSWAQLKNMPAPGPEDEERGLEEKKPKEEKKVKEKKVKSTKSEETADREMKKKKVKKSKSSAPNAEEANEEGEKKKKVKKSSKKEKDTLRDKATLSAQPATVRQSSSSFEVGHLTASPEVKKTDTKSLGKKKHSILGLGLPSTMRLPTIRSGSTVSSTMNFGTVAPSSSNRLSVESAFKGVLGRDRAGSTISTASSLRPVSIASSASRGSSNSSGAASIRWDEEGLETVKEQRRKERKEREKEKRAEGRESRHSSEGRRRTPLSEVFPDMQRRASGESQMQKKKYPILMIEEATADGHGSFEDCSLHEDSEDGDGAREEQKAAPAATPVKRARPRPMSEQLLGKSRPRPMYESEDGVLSILDAATNDLAQLINILDLEATPATPDMTPLRPSPLSFEKLAQGGGDESPSKNTSAKKRGLLSESPLKKTLRDSTASISSLRPYGQSRGLKSSSSSASLKPGIMIGQQIAPWPMQMGLESVTEASSSPSPAKSSKAAPTPPSRNSTFRPSHKRTMTPAREPDPEPVFHPLPAAKPRGPIRALKFSPAPTPSTVSVHTDGALRPPSSTTFGSASSSRAGSKGSLDEFASGSPTPTGSVFKREHRRQRSSLIPDDCYTYKGSWGSIGDGGVPLARETRRVLGMSGTMGGSDVSGYNVPELDVSDPDSDVPDELRYILSANSDRGSMIEDTLSYRDVRDEDEEMTSGSPHELPVPLPELPQGPPRLELPVFRAALVDDEGDHADIDEGGLTSEEDTKKSFDFTGELQKLNESGGSDRRSFVEQLENAFRTPAKVDLRYLKDGLLCVEVPPVPKLPLDFSIAVDTDESSSAFDSYSASQIVEMKEPTLMHMTTKAEEDSKSKSNIDLYTTSRLVDMKEPTLLPGSDSLASSTDVYDSIMDGPSEPSLRSSTSSSSRPSNGQLNTSFKFGGMPTSAPAAPKQEKPMTLSDIIPPPSHVRSLSASSMMDEDDSVLKSIFAKVSDIPQPRERVDSESSSKEFPQEVGRNSQYVQSRPASGVSFFGLDSFDEVRRGFEFTDSRPTFYPAPPVSRRNNHRQHDSIFSIASVSSYGRVLDSGSTDPFDYGLPSLRERPSSEAMSMSMSMSMSVDDTFSFLDRQPVRRRVDSDASSFYFRAPLTQQGFTRGHRRHESNMSVSSQAPPISMYNRSFGAHRRNDSTTSASSVAMSYAMHGANGGRAAWARHRQDASMDSVMSDFSALRLGRPGIGDKMFDSDHAMPLTAISASPSESLAAPRFDNRSSFDSILDDDRRSSMDDSLFEKTGHRTSVSSDSVFGDDCFDPNQGGLLPPGQFRPLSIISLNSVHSPMKDDDTMISMLGGGHVRRRSVGSIVETSPCVRVEKRKHSAFQPIKSYADYYESPNKARIVEKPSIASTSSYQFGGERMIKAQRGLLERQSLEDSCLIADGEDLSTSLGPIPVFTRPGPASRSRSSTCTSSSGGDTPPLSVSDGSSVSGGSQSSIDLSHLNLALANATYPMSTLARNRNRARARGHGHRRRYSKAHASRSSVYETIQEEISVASSPARSLASKKSSPTTCQPIFIVDADTASIHSTNSMSVWDDERGIVALRKYYALRDEVTTTVTESKRQWSDTAFSLFAVQSFQPPRHPAGMQALLEHSVQNYGPLPSELRPRRVRSRTQSRPSPYPQARIAKVTTSPEQTRPSNADLHRSFATPAAVLQQILVNANIMPSAPSLEALKPFSPFMMNVEPKRENAFGLAPNARPRVASTTRRTALGWSKRSNGAKHSTDQKENVVGQGMIMTPGESLRINRPRPRGRATPATQPRALRV
ncbi:hypothetical protein BDQ12DRAFT_448473 [Crucibulum laeve]|uniref:Uncharacterized protein n=1 Tax=Crucibulum laeve TaxID=68775 RepID=A0A5C3LKB5_9AGAR|nr:hypothetical protein BDQ12DRAFT_448473 [Crucibulum laeve]